MTSSLGGFFGGSKGITWPDQPPKKVSGTITAVHPPEAVNDPKTGLPTDRQQVRIELSTDERDPEIQFDDGARTLYVKSYMRSAIGDALRRAGAKEPQIGGTLTVTFVRTEAPERPGLSASKHFEAVYEAPSPGTAEHFGTNGQVGTAQVPPPVAAATPPKPDGISDAAWAAMDAATRATVAATMPPPPAAAGPVKPDAISDAAWASMDAATRATVAATMSVGSDKAPF
jgi:hypothetical protein